MGTLSNELHRCLAFLFLLSKLLILQLPYLYLHDHAGHQPSDFSDTIQCMSEYYFLSTWPTTGGGASAGSSSSGGGGGGGAGGENGSQFWQVSTE